MSVATELQTLQTNIGNAYTTIGTKGGTVPANKNTDNLATAIDSIPSGGTPQPLDPQVVYQQTRPADWLEMPTPGMDEAYMLIQIPADSINDQNLSCSIGGTGDRTVAFGTVSSGTFVPDPDLVYTQNDQAFTISVPVSKFGNQTSDGMLQLMCKIYGTSIASIHGGSSSSTLYKRIVEFRGGNLASLVAINPGTSQNYAWVNLRYFSLGRNNITSGGLSLFANCLNLIAIPSLDTSTFLSAQKMFQNCSKLIAIPALDLSSASDCSYLFNNCYSLETIPLINTSSGTDFSYMFSGCYALEAVPLIDTSSGTDFSGMFNTCYSIKEIPALNTSNGTNFASMVSNCFCIKTIPAFDTSKGTNFTSMCTSDRSLETIPLLDTSKGTIFYQMFYNCTSLTSIPNLDTGEGTNFQGMFQSCTSLTELPNFDTSNSTNCNTMFSGATSIGYFDLSNYDFSKVTSTTGLSALMTPRGGTTVRFNPTLDQNKIYNTSAIIGNVNNFISPTNVLKIIFPQNSMVQIVANATTLFTNNANVFVYVPDDLLATYQADTYWATLGARLKPLSDWSA